MAAGNMQGTYSAEQVIITVGGVIVSGFTDGDYVTCKYNDQRYTAKAGADGEVARSKTASRMGTIEIVLSHTSAANNELGQLFNLDLTGGESPTVPIEVADLSGTGLVQAANAWVQTSPDFVRGTEVGDATWTFECADLVFTY